MPVGNPMTPTQCQKHEFMSIRIEPWSNARWWLGLSDKLHLCGTCMGGRVGITYQGITCNQDPLWEKKGNMSESVSCFVECFNAKSWLLSYLWMLLLYIPSAVKTSMKGLYSCKPVTLFWNWMSLGFSDGAVDPATKENCYRKSLRNKTFTLKCLPWSPDSPDLIQTENHWDVLHRQVWPMESQPPNIRDWTWC